MYSNDSNSHIEIALITLASVVITIILAGVLYVWASALVGSDQSDLEGTWYNAVDTLTLYEDGTGVDSTGTLDKWSSSGDRLAITFITEGVMIDSEWKYEIVVDSDGDRILFMASYEFENGSHTDKIEDNSCIIYVDNVKAADVNYLDNKYAIIPNWCDFE